MRIIDQIEKEKESSWKATHLIKLNTLRALQNLPSNIQRTAILVSPIKNYSKRVLTTEEILALENGLDFIFPSFVFDEESFVANVETLFVNLLGYCSDKYDYEERDVEDKITYNLTPEQLLLANKLRKCCDTFRQNAYKSSLNFKREMGPIIKTLKNLSKDKSIHITRADKGRAVVILDKTDYIKKMEIILNDANTFQQLEADPTLQKEDKLQQKLLQLKDSGFITEAEYRLARPVGSQPGKAYGLPKIQKTDIPLRPIISACNTFSYKLSKLLAKKLKHLRASPTIITDTFEFVEELHSLKIDSAKIKMVSFDIISLFTRVPLTRTIQLILEKMYGPEHTCTYSQKKRDEWCSNCKNRYELKWLLEIATKESHFVFNGKRYCQVEGIAMGSPLGPLFADIYVNYLESKLKHRLEANGMVNWKRFVDDCFVLVQKDANIDKLLEILNSFDMDIQFTAEPEENNSLSFLDILITRTPNSSGSYLNQGQPDEEILGQHNIPLALDDITQSSTEEYDHLLARLSHLSAEQLHIIKDIRRRSKNKIVPFSTSIYRKPTFTGLLLKWTSFVPHFYKVSAISSMVYRAIRICSTYQLLHTEFEFIQNLAMENGYPNNFVQSQIRKTLNRHFEKSKTSITPSAKVGKTETKIPKKEQVFIDLPYVGNATKILGKKIIDLAKRVRPNLHVQPISRPPPAIATYFSQKDKIHKDLQSHLVYMVSCSNCDDTYIGKTIRQASRRLHEHGAPQQCKSSSTPQLISTVSTQQELRRSDRNKGKPKVDYFPTQIELEDENQTSNNERLKKSALYKHQIETNHNIDWTQWKIISKDLVKYRLLVRESLQILEKKPSLNRTVCSVPLIIYPEGLQLSKPKVKIKSVTR